MYVTSCVNSVSCVFAVGRKYRDQTIHVFAGFLVPKNWCIFFFIKENILVLKECKGTYLSMYKVTFGYVSRREMLLSNLNNLVFPLITYGPYSTQYINWN